MRLGRVLKIISYVQLVLFIFSGLVYYKTYSSESVNAALVGCDEKTASSSFMGCDAYFHSCYKLISLFFLNFFFFFFILLMYRSATFQ